MSAYSADIAAGKELTVQGFSQIILSATNESNETLWNTQQFNASRRSDFYLSLVLDGLAALQVLKQQIQDANNYENLLTLNLQDINTLNTDIQTYNGNVTPLAQPNLDAVNQAINQYNNNQISLAQLNTAIDTYNSNAASYNSQVVDVNSSISAFNSNATSTNQRVAIFNADSPDTTPYVGQTLDSETAAQMPILSNISASQSIPIPNVSFTPTTLDAVSNTMVPASSGNVDTLIQTLNDNYQAYLNNNQVLTSFLNDQSTQQNFVQFFLQDNNPTLPPSFYTPNAQPNLNSGGPSSAGPGGGLGSGVSLSTLITSLSNPLMSAIIDRSIFSASMDLESLPGTPTVVNHLQFLTSSLLAQVGLQAGSSAIGLLADRLTYLDPGSPSALVVVGTTLASEIALCISSGCVANGVNTVVAQAYPNLDSTAQAALASQLTAAIELILLQSAVLQLSQTLQAPQLSGQVLGTIPSAQALATSSTTVDVNTEALKSALASNLANQLNSSYDSANQLITDSVISAAIQQQSNNQAIVNELTQNGVSTQAAINTAAYAQSYVKAETLGRGTLDNSLSQERLQQSILSNQLVSQLTAGQSDITNRQLRDQLAQEFVNSGNTQEKALVSATLAVVGNGGISPTNLETLKSSLLQTATQKLAALGNSSSETNSIAHKLVSTILGPNVPGSQTSIRNLIDQRLQVLLKSNDAKFAEAVQASLTQFLEPNLELYAFADALRDPANTFLLCAQTGLMYAHPQPSNYQKSVDIIV